MELTIESKLNTFNALEKEIHNYFGYVEDWVKIPMESHIGEYWMLTGDKKARGCAVYSPVPLTKKTIEAGSEIYGGPIYTQRFLPKWVYRGEDYTMVSVNTQTDGNRFLMIFENSKECTDDNLCELYDRRWGCL